ncbi:MAG: hypothetical protein GY774_35595 [Planctomycetes bacterium]|nr:hypothetical protein [Planctomycetota bacterium]
MKRTKEHSHLLNFDRYGYCIGMDEISAMSQQEINDMIAGYHNRQKGFIENLSGSFCYDDGSFDIDHHNCSVAMDIGNNECYCGHHD